MSREIKYRAWNPYDRVMYRTTKDEDALLGTSYEIALWDGGWEMCAITGYGKQVVVARLTRTGESGGTLMQFTGLKDRNGVEIYEGDVVSINKGMGTAEILWATVGFVFHFVEDKFSYKGAMNHSLDTVNERILEVIGNIYENPDLLKAVV